MEWGGGNSAFLFQAEYMLFTEKMNATSFSHPLVLLPFAGQVLLLVSYYFPNAGRKLAITGIILLGLLVMMILIAGLLSKNIGSTLSTLPFIGLSLFYIFAWKKSI